MRPTHDIRRTHGLIGDTSSILLDAAAVAKKVKLAIMAAIEADADNRFADLHVWYLNQTQLAATISLVTHNPQSLEDYKQLLTHVSVLVEVHHCYDPACLGTPAGNTYLPEQTKPKCVG